MVDFLEWQSACSLCEIQLILTRWSTWHKDLKLPISQTETETSSNFFVMVLKEQKWHDRLYLEIGMSTTLYIQWKVYGARCRKQHWSRIECQMVASSTIHIQIWENRQGEGQVISFSPWEMERCPLFSHKSLLRSSKVIIDGVGLSCVSHWDIIHHAFHKHLTNEIFKKLW